MPGMVRSLTVNCTVLLLLIVSSACTPNLHNFSREMLDRQDESSSMDSAFQQDVTECHRDVLYESNREALLGTAHVMFLERDLNRCLEARGWSPTPGGDHAYRLDTWTQEAVVVK